MKSVRALNGRFIRRREARYIAAQVTSLPIEEPAMPDFAARPRHWHEDCECWEQIEAPSRGFWRRWTR